MATAAANLIERPGPARARVVAERTLAAPATLALAIGATLAAVSFYAKGGASLEPTTYTHIALMLAGAGLAALALAAGDRRPVHGGFTLAALVGLTGFTALSVIWSLAPADSWLEANRMLAYVATFAGGLSLSRLLGGRWAALLHGVALAAVVVCGWALLTKIFPSAFAENETFARLRAPFDYWNSVGLTAATGVMALLWLGARRSGRAAVNALAYPGIGLLLVCLMLAYSRGALLALLIGVAAWFAVVPLRLRGAVVLGVPAVFAGLVTAWAFGQDGLTKDRLTDVLRDDAGHELGVLLLLMTVLLTAAGLAIGFAGARRPPSARVREIAGRIAVGAVALALLGGFVGVAASEGGLSGQWNKLTDPDARTPANTPERLTATASVRARYWREAFKIHAGAKWLGTGAGAYATARKRHRTSELNVVHAHGYVVQVLADLGFVGLAVSLAALAAWLAAAAVALGLRRRDRGLPWDAERVGVATLAAIVVVFGVHSAIDWTWFVPANAVFALLCAGWVAGRGPLRDRYAAAGLPVGERPPERGPWRLVPWRAAAGAALVIVALAAAWTAFQPVRALHAGDVAIGRLEKKAYAPAASIARIAAKRNPLSVEPLWELAAIEQAAGKPRTAEEALEAAVRLQPANSEAWRRLGRFRLVALNDAETAEGPLRAAYYLDPRNPDVQSDFLAVLRQLAATPAP